MDKKLLVAIIEDDAAIANMYRIKFELSGFSIIVAHNGQDGFELISNKRPNLVLLDIKMPVMTGNEMLAKVRAQEWGPNIKVIVLTNISRSEAPHDLRLLHVDRYMVKAHHTPNQIVDCAKELLRI